MAGGSAGYQHDTWTDNRLSADRWESEWGTTSGYLTEENTDRADGSQTTTEESTTEEEWKSIISGEYYKQAKVSGQTNLYQLDMKVEEDGIYINKMFALGDALESSMA